MKVSQMFPSKWLKAADIEGPTLVTIRKWESVMLRTDEGEEEKPAVFFEETDKGLILNVTNTNMIAAILKSDESDDWDGKQIGLRTEMVAYRGKMAPAIRVFDPTPPQTGGFGKKTAAPAVDDVPTSWPAETDATQSAAPSKEEALPWQEGDSVPDPGDPMRSKRRK